MHRKTKTLLLVLFFLGFVGLVMAIILLAGQSIDISTQANSDTPITEVSVLDVGQGDAIFIEAPNGVQMLIDGGPDDSVLVGLGQVMGFWDRSIDFLLETHPDKDHIAGFLPILEQYEVGAVIESGYDHSDSSYYRRKEALIQEYGVTKNQVRQGDIVWLDRDEQVFFEVLYPFSDAVLSNSNDSSIVGRLVHGQTCIMFPGDASDDIEAQTVYENPAEKLDCQVLKVGHHGSKTSTAQGFLNAVNPEVAVISAGRDNRYGHPHQVVTDRLTASAIDWFSTQDFGTITLEMDGEVITVYP